MNIPDLYSKIKAWLRTETGHLVAVLAILIASNVWSFYLGSQSVKPGNNLQNMGPGLESDYSLADPELPKQGTLAAAILSSSHESPDASVSSQNAPGTGLSGQNGEEAPRYVASKNGRVYYFTWCAGAKRIAEENRVYFNTPSEARAAGLTPSTACEGLE